MVTTFRQMMVGYRLLSCTTVGQNYLIKDLLLKIENGDWGKSVLLYWRKKKENLDFKYFFVVVLKRNLNTLEFF